MKLFRSIFRALSTPRTGLFGQSLTDAQRGDFFQWFQLRSEGTDTPDGQARRRDFRPAGASFHDFVLVSLWIDRDDQVQRARLSLSRTFIDDRRQGMFARDIAKSFLRAAVRENLPAELSDLANEIEFDRTGVGVPVLMGADRPRPPLPKSPSRAYLAFLGQADACTFEWPHGIAILENIAAAQGGQFYATLSAVPD